MQTHVNGLDARVKSIVTLIEGTEVFSPDQVRKLKTQQEEFESRLEKKIEDLERSFTGQRLPTPRPIVGFSPILDRHDVFFTQLFNHFQLNFKVFSLHGTVVTIFNIRLYQHLWIHVPNDQCLISPFL